MGRLFSGCCVVLLLFLAAGLVSCGRGTSSTPFPIPGEIILTPTPTLSIDLGMNQSFTAVLHDFQGHVIAAEPVTWQTSDASIVTVASNGLVCAGSWDSLTNPQICTPGKVGVALVTAAAQGVNSPPTTVYVHQHVDKIVVAQAPSPTPLPPCISKKLTQVYSATATSHGVDVTSTVGPFSFTLANPLILSISTTAAGLQLWQAQLTGDVPGMTQITASAANTTSVPMEVSTCPVESISLNVSGTPDTSFSVPSGQSRTVSATIVDSQGVTISDVPLAWCTSSPVSVGVGSSSSGSSASNCTSVTGTNGTDQITVTTPSAGGGAVTATCSPPGCNAGFTPSLPIYATVPISATVNKASTSTPATRTVWVGSTGCGTTDGCISTLFPISVPTNTVGSQVVLPATPDSLVFNRGGMAFLGTDFGLLGTRGLMAVNATAVPATVGQFTNIVGKILAVSPGGTKLVVSDTLSTPNQVYIFDTSASAAANFQITGATAAAFTPDNVRAFILAGSTLDVYSTVDGLQSMTLSAPATDVAFLPSGLAGYIAGGDPAGVAFLPTCNSPAVNPVGVSATATQIRALSDGKTLLTLAPPNMQTITATATSTPGLILDPPACPLTAPTPITTITNTSSSPVNLGQGNFTPIQFLVSSDGTHAYILEQNVSSVLVFDVGNQITSSITLSGNVTATAAALSADGSTLYVTASDGKVHVLDTSGGGDIQQISLPQSLCLGTGNTTFACTPNLIAIQ